MQGLADIDFEVGSKDCARHLVDHSDVSLLELGKLGGWQMQVVEMSTAHTFRIVQQCTED